jgi:hypothetical protein
MQVQCGDVTYFVLAPTLGIQDQVVVRTLPLAEVLESSVGQVAPHSMPPLTVDVNGRREVLGMAWDGAPEAVRAAPAIEASDEAAVIWLQPSCECARHTLRHCTVLTGACITTAHPQGTHREPRAPPCYVKVSRLSALPGWV